MTPRITKDEKPRLWKNYIDRASLQRLGAVMAGVYPAFKTEAFTKSLIADKFDQLELKARIALIARRLHDYLPKDYTRAAKVIIKAAPNLPGFHNWVLTSYVEQFGLDDLKTSVRAMEELTRYGSSEFVVRHFIVQYPEEMIAVLHRWAEDDNEHVRRLAAEGSRPRGVWTIHIEAFRRDPRPVVALLEKLRADDSLYVRKAVANNLNDISKDHPDIVLATSLSWMKANDPRTNWILKRACRSLIKLGRPDVFPLFGFTAKPSVEVNALAIAPRKPRIGADAVISFEVVSTSQKPQKLAIDYKLHYFKANGSHSPKVFKLTEKTLKAGEVLPLSVKHSFRPMTTRVHYPGEHAIEVVINGVSYAKLSFALRKA